MKSLTEDRDLFGNVIERKAGGKLQERFLVPPFSVLDARQGYWQERKREWIALGIKGEEGRVNENSYQDLDKAGPLESPGLVQVAASNPGRCFGQDLMKGENPSFGSPMTKGLAIGEVPSYDGADRTISGTSIFDPVLCELTYRWFCPPAGRILDPFAGESTKGIVAAHLGYQYTGIELRPEQVAANQRQAERIGVAPTWICSDAAKLEEAVWLEDDFDLIFTSPPYYDLEIYSRSEKDGSAFETYPKFMAWYRDVFAQAVAHLKQNRFLVVKVGEIRDERGLYRNFIGDNISCFLDLGLKYYNEIILVTAVGSLPVRIGKQFASYRKIGKTHQNILVFYKGEDPKRIKAEFGTADMFAAEGQGDAGNQVSS